MISIQPPLGSHLCLIRSTRFQSIPFPRRSSPFLAFPLLFYAIRCSSAAIPCKSTPLEAFLTLFRSLLCRAALFPRASSPCFSLALLRNAIPTLFCAAPTHSGLFRFRARHRFSHAFLRCALALLGRASPFPRFSALLRFNGFRFRSIRFLSSPFCSFSRLSSLLHGLG